MKLIHFVYYLIKLSLHLILALIILLAMLTWMAILSLIAGICFIIANILPPYGKDANK